MDKQRNLLSKTLLMVIFILFIGMSISTSTGNNIIVSFICKSNNPPYDPSDPVPPNGGTNVCGCNVKWSGGDPDGDLVLYDIYFGNITPPPMIINNRTETYFDYQGDCEFNTIYYWKIVSKDEHGATTEGPIWNFTTNCNPDVPVISGPKHGRVKIKYEWTFVSIDPEENNITYYVDWGDECGGADFHGPYHSGEVVTLAHTYNRNNTYIIKVIAIDEYGAESNTTYYEVTMSRTREAYCSLFYWFLEHFPLLERLLIILI